MTGQEELPELLAPAGNTAALHAAVTAGADAVYLGLDEFNARRNAGNFTLDELPDACDYAHMRSVAVYVTMNVEILPGEISRAFDYACRAYQSGADAVIVQDIGLAAKLARRAPHVPLHVSTQMNIHNAAGVEAAARLGAKRITLARELSVAEIAELSEIARTFDMETECFAHGALCICYSGQCLMSSMIGGRSANRGLCAQACRLPYELHRAGRVGALPAQGEHLLSPRDLCAADMIEDLARAGVTSLKVEGRMKSADYVHEVVSVYREVLDSKRPATAQHRARLDEAFSRGFTTAYLGGERGNGIMSYGRPNNRGVFVGRIGHVGDGFVETTPETDLHDGDIVEIWTNRGHFSAHVAQTISSGKAGRIAIEGRAGKGDRIFRIRNAATAFADDPLAPRIPISGRVELALGQPAFVEFAAPDGTCAEARGNIVEPARTKAVSEDDVRTHVNRLGQTPFRLDDAALSVELADGVGIGFSQLHHLRARALEQLSEKMLAPWRRQAGNEEGNLPASHKDALAVSPPRALATRGKRHAPASIISALAANPRCARAAKRAGADALYVPILNFRRGHAQLEGTLLAEAEQAGYPKQCTMALPTVDHDPVGFARECGLSFDLWDYVRSDKPVFADSLADALRALGLGALVEVGPHVPVTNASAIELLAELGVSRIWLSPELTLGQLADLAEASPVELGLFVSGAQELMVTEHCLLMSQGPCNEECESCARRGVAHRLVDRKGFEFPVVTDALGRSHLYNGIELDAVPALPDLIDIGISSFMVDTTLMDERAAASAVKRVVRARELALTQHRSLDKRPGTTTGHLFRGVM